MLSKVFEGHVTTGVLISR